MFEKYKAKKATEREQKAQAEQAVINGLTQKFDTAQKIEDMGERYLALQDIGSEVARKRSSIQWSMRQEVRKKVDYQFFGGMGGVVASFPLMAALDIATTGGVLTVSGFVIGGLGMMVTAIPRLNKLNDEIYTRPVFKSLGEMQDVINATLKDISENHVPELARSKVALDIAGKDSALSLKLMLEFKRVADAVAPVEKEKPVEPVTPGVVNKNFRFKR